MSVQNLQLQMEKVMDNINPGEALLLHACCAPCSSSVLEKLAERFTITYLYYNPNIWPAAEYARRRDEAVELLKKLQTKYPVTFVEIPYNEDSFLEAAAGKEGEREGGSRCAVCFEMRLQEAAKQAAQRGIQWFTTTLSVSPHKNAALLNKLGGEAGERYGVSFLPSDFKKKDGYKRSIELSEKYNLYRQQYCGCRFSYRQRFGNENGQ